MNTNNKSYNLNLSRKALPADAEGIRFYAVIAGAYLLAPLADFFLTLMGL